MVVLDVVVVVVLVDVLVRNPVPEVGHHSPCSLSKDGRSGNTEQIALKPTALTWNNGTSLIYERIFTSSWRVLMLVRLPSSGGTDWIPLF